MNLVEVYGRIVNSIEALKLNSSWISGGGDTPYRVTDLDRLRSTINKLQDIPYVSPEIEAVKKSWLYNTALDSLAVTSSDKTMVENLLATIKIKFITLKDVVESSSFVGREDLLFIKLPELTSFDDLSKASNDLKKAIELPIADESIKGSVAILAADKGSVVLYVALGTILAVKLVAAICWSAAVIKKKNAEAKIFEAHAKTLELKNESLENLVEAQKQQIKNIIQAEAEAIATKNYSHNDPEAIERLKLSITTVADLIERGAKILPMGNSEDLQKSFPDYSAISLIESSMKQLKDGA